ncbi:hypothetical protein AI3057V1_1476 [Citrobacter freundii]|uniref:hypothetical protein n=1 Tax=Citrobacter freundii TaxID=546 RepID=UPI001E13FD51|nr:hypothetical protein [Citrobacter freundii]CAG0338797.1 hypothetical protein AI3057V1_1476 [Citrobacter freundii]CAH6020480.1 hypothetical protein AI3057V1_1476 [Citrobacter freundii]
MSVYQGLIVLSVVFFISLFISFGKESNKKRTIARAVVVISSVILVVLFFSLRGEFSEIDKCKIEYQGFYTNNALCYGTVNVTHNYLDTSGISVVGIMNISPDSAVIKTEDGRTLIVTKSSEGFAVHQ